MTTILRFEDLTVHDRSSQSKLVCILKIVPKAKSARKRRHLYAILRYLPVDIEGRSLPFHITAQSKDHLYRSAINAGSIRLKLSFWRNQICDSCHKLTYGKIRWADTVYRRYDTSKHMIHTMILPGVFYAHDITHALHNTYGPMVARSIGADGACLLI